MLRLPVTFAVFIIAASCSSKQVKQPPVLDNKTVVVAQLKENLPVDTVIRSIPCKTAPAQSFSLYLPPSYSSNVPFPVLMFFDPHGDGSVRTESQPVPREFFLLPVMRRDQEEPFFRTMPRSRM